MQEEDIRDAKKIGLCRGSTPGEHHLLWHNIRPLGLLGMYLCHSKCHSLWNLDAMICCHAMVAIEKSQMKSNNIADDRMAGRATAEHTELLYLYHDHSCVTGTSKMQRCYAMSHNSRVVAA